MATATATVMALQPMATVEVVATAAPTDTPTAGVAAMAPEAMAVAEVAMVALEATRCPTLVQA